MALMETGIHEKSASEWRAPGHELDLAASQGGAHQNSTSSSSTSSGSVRAATVHSSMGGNFSMRSR